MPHMSKFSKEVLVWTLGRLPQSFRGKAIILTSDAVNPYQNSHLRNAPTRIGQVLLEIFR